MNLHEKLLYNSNFFKLNFSFFLNALFGLIIIWTNQHFFIIKEIIQYVLLIILKSHFRWIHRGIIFLLQFFVIEIFLIAKLINCHFKLPAHFPCYFLYLLFLPAHDSKNYWESSYNYTYYCSCTHYCRLVCYSVPIHIE